MTYVTVNKLVICSVGNLFLANVTPTKICQATKNLDETHLVGGVEDICHTELAPKHHTRNMENKMI